MTSTHEAVTAETITLAQVKALRAEAAEAGDVAMVDTCERAMLAVYDPARGSDAAPHDHMQPSLEAVVDTINDARAQG